MRLIDANILLYAYDGSSTLHGAAKRWLEKNLSEAKPIRLAWVTILAFLRIATHRKIYANPYSIAEATAIVDDWLARPCMGILQPTARHWPILTALLQNGQATGPLVMDAHLAALRTTADFGHTWQDITPPLCGRSGEQAGSEPGSPRLTALAVDPTRSAHLFTAASFGATQGEGPCAGDSLQHAIFETWDSGATWQAVNSLAPGAVTSLAYVASEAKLLATIDNGTAGAGEGAASVNPLTDAFVERLRSRSSGPVAPSLDLERLSGLLRFAGQHFIKNARQRIDVCAVIDVIDTLPFLLD